jgi:hypothetical protein
MLFGTIVLGLDKWLRLGLQPVPTSSLRFVFGKTSLAKMPGNLTRGPGEG